MHRADTCCTGCDNEKGKKKCVEICQKSAEIQENCDPRRKWAEGNDKQESPGKIAMVGKYDLQQSQVFIGSSSDRSDGNMISGWTH